MYIQLQCIQYCTCTFLQVGDRLIHNMTARDFSEFFQTEAPAGTTLKIVPHMDKKPVESMDVSITIVILLSCNCGIITCSCNVYLYIVITIYNVQLLYT